MCLSRRIHFYHRSNRDGTTESICSRCFLRVAREFQASELARYEIAHVCDPAKVFDVSQNAEATASGLRAG